MTALRDLITHPNAAELELIARYGMLPEDPRRARAFEAFAANGLPHRRLEHWRWSDVRAALPELARPKAVDRADPLADGSAVFRFTPSAFVAPSAQIDGVRVLAQPHVQAVASAEDLPLGALAAALSGGKGRPSTLVIEVTAPVATRLHFVFDGAGEGNFGRVMLLVRAGASVEISESYLGGAGLTASLMEITLEHGAKASRTVYQSGGADETVAINAQIDLQSGAHFTQTTLSFGARLARLETRLTLSGTGASAILNAAYLAAAGRHSDITTHVRHNAVACMTRQITKGAVRKGGRGVFQGKFLVPRTTGQKTDASMQHHALLLEDGAEVFAKPELEIHADDVQCAHGNTSGALDQNQLFYLRQRGLPEAEARALLTQAFIAEALESAGPLEDILRAEASRWFSP